MEGISKYLHAHYNLSFNNPAENLVSDADSSIQKIDELAEGEIHYYESILLLYS